MKGENMNYYPKLKSLIDKIDELLKIPDLTADSKEFVDWQIRTELFLSRCYGQESTQMKRFQHTEFVPYFDFDNRNERNKKCRDGLEKTKEIFEIYLDEIEEDNFNRTMDSIHGKLSRPQLSVAIPKIEEKVISGKIIMKKKYQVFISSTYEDLKEERAAVTQCLLNNNCIPVGMEQFPASNMSQMEYIKKMLDDCDYYILIIGGRYGSLDDDGIGYTEKEYNYAIQKSIPVMAFVNAHPEKLPNEKCEQTDAGREKFKAFRNRVWAGYGVIQFQRWMNKHLTRCSRKSLQNILQQMKNFKKCLMKYSAIQKNRITKRRRFYVQLWLFSLRPLLFAAIEAEKVFSTSPAMCAVRRRKALELAVR